MSEEKLGNRLIAIEESIKLQNQKITGINCLIVDLDIKAKGFASSLKILEEKLEVLKITLKEFEDKIFVNNDSIDTFALYMNQELANIHKFLNREP